MKDTKKNEKKIKNKLLTFSDRGFIRNHSLNDGSNFILAIHISPPNITTVLLIHPLPPKDLSAHDNSANPESWSWKKDKRKC